ncbi:MAG TPA: cytochrome P460 family protein [Polyangiales bacterium]|nr:cytochrome P460 family protein [Polyangiales bacterium]
MSTENSSTGLPPQGARAVEAWLATGAYEDWTCEPEVHEARSPSPHGWNRICSNDAIASHARDKDAWPLGAAAVKELYASADAKQPKGYAVYVKTEADSADGAHWYWYERLTPDGDPVADGMGDEGTAKTICVACHAAAGSDDAHTPSPGGRDQVYTPVH